MQMPTATHVASFRSWKRDFNRYVRKGERGIEIRVPMLVKDREARMQTWDAVYNAATMVEAGGDLPAPDAATSVALDD